MHVVIGRAEEGCADESDGGSDAADPELDEMRRKVPSRCWLRQQLLHVPLFSHGSTEVLCRQPLNLLGSAEDKKNRDFRRAVAVPY